MECKNKAKRNFSTNIIPTERKITMKYWASLEMLPWTKLKNPTEN